jgi:transcriptional regulator with XRE-family HTH domain
LVNNYANGIPSVGFCGIKYACHPQKHNGTSVKLFDRVLNPREIRRRLGLNQEQFWTQIGVTQSGGSRYESGREMPKPVRELLRLVHVEQIDLSQVKRVDFEIISYLKESHPDLYRSLRRAVRSKHKHPDGEPVLLGDDELLHEHAGATGEVTGPN